MENEKVESLEECPPYALLTKQEYYLEQKQEVPALIRMYQRGDELYKEVIREYANSGQIKKEVNVSAKRKRNAEPMYFYLLEGDVVHRQYQKLLPEDVRSRGKY